MSSLLDELAVALLLDARVLQLGHVALEVGQRLRHLGLPLRERRLGLAELGAGRLATLASVCRSAASRGRGSMVKSRSPRLTSCPSVKCT